MFTGLAGALVLWSLSWYLLEKPRTGVSVPLPDFTAYQDVGEMKRAFYDYLQPMVQRQNEVIEGQRQQLLAIAASLESGAELQAAQRRYLDRLSKRYRLPDDAAAEQERLRRLLMRVDTVPQELALVQAAKESGWGRSRFAVTANNLFGQWCYDPGCGLVPSKRGKGKVHEVQTFDTIEDAIADYLLNLNTHPRYKPMRDIRVRLRRAGNHVSGTALADGLLHYSERRQAYVDELKSMIRQYRQLKREARSS